MKREISAGGVVFRKDGETKVLLIKDPSGKWSLPKGLIEKGETSEQAALREVSEETGLKKLKIIEKLGDIKYYYKLKGETIFKIVVFFLMEAEDSDLTPQWEIQDAKWFPIGDALENIGYKNSKDIVSLAIERIRSFV